APTPADHPAAPQNAAVTVEWRDADQCGNLPTVEVAQFGQIGHECQGGDGTHAGDRSQQVFGVSPRGAGANRVVEVGLEILKGTLQPPDVGVDPALESSVASLAPAIALGPEHVQKLSAPADEFAKTLNVVRGQGAGDWADGFRKPGDDLGVEGVGLGERADGPREVTN